MNINKILVDIILKRASLDDTLKAFNIKPKELGTPYAIGERYLVLESGSKPRWYVHKGPDEILREEDELDEKTANLLGFYFQ